MIRFLKYEKDNELMDLIKQKIEHGKIVHYLDLVESRQILHNNFFGSELGYSILYKNPIFIK